ncbi:MAG: AAA family ATPase [Bacteroidales bacterium]|nr:AAA family ATPase [Bacteroidales bacterium]
MSETIKLQHTEDNRYICEPVVSQKEWLKILNASMADGHKKQIENLLLFYRHKDNKATCYDLGKEYSRPSESVNILVTNFNKYAKKHLGNRFQIEAAENTEETFWPISMLGRVTSTKRFEWTVRPELCAAIKQFLIQNMYNSYRKLVLAEGLDNSTSKERYKWEVLSSCSGKTTEEIIRILFRSNLVDAKYEGATINELLKTNLSELCGVFDILREEVSFNELFANKFKPAAKALTPAGKTSFGTERTAAAFLAALKPQEYTPFTSTLYEDYCKYIGVDTLSAGHKYSHFLELLKELVEIERDDIELTGKIKSETQGLIYSDMLNAQDILWQMIRYFKVSIPKTWLQEIYDESLVEDTIFKEGGWFSRYEPTVKLLRSSILESEDAAECVNIVRSLILKQNNGIADVGLGGKFNSNDYPLVEGAWPELYPILKQSVINDEITPESEKKVSEIINSLKTKRKHPTAINRIWSGLFPNYLSTTVDSRIFYSIYDYLHKNLGLEKPAWNWIKDNIAIIQFLNKRVEFQNPWHSSLFVWYLSHFINTPEKNTAMDKYIKLLEANHNLILTGAPGTGKTYLAKQIAKAMGATEEGGNLKMVQFHPSYDYTDFVEGLRPRVNGDGFEREDGVFKAFCAKALKNIEDSNKNQAILQQEADMETKLSHFLDEAIDNETKFKTKTGNEFYISEANKKNVYVEIPDNDKASKITIQIKEILAVLNATNRPTAVKDLMTILHQKYNTQHNSYTFVICEEIFKSEAKATTVSTVEAKKFVFIVDEINRGELSKIFGELFFAIDPGYRGKKGVVETQYQNLVEAGDPFENGFYVPENVYIIGTMNDIDRSVESMDFAIRRRFAWCEVEASTRTEMLDEVIPELAEEAKASMTALNDAIVKVGLTSAYHIGPAYYTKLNNYDGNVQEQFECLWKYHIKGLLLEYLRGTRGIEDKLAELKKAFDSFNS